MNTVLSYHPTIDAVRHTANAQLDPARKSALGQFMTPSPVARFMASLFQNWDRAEVRLLDAGAGVGSLTAAFWDAWIARVPKGSAGTSFAFEIDETMCAHLVQTLDAYQTAVTAHGCTLHAELVLRDFIELGTENLLFRVGDRYTHAILNPPYKKMKSISPHRLMLRQVDIETVNLYTAFVAVAIALMEEGGELVAIIPRSWCNGAYYRPFREWMQRHAALTHLHLFESRSKAFKDDEVLQENVIVRWVRGAPQEDVIVSQCADSSFVNLQRQAIPFTAIVQPGDPDIFVRIPMDLVEASSGANALFSHTLQDIGLEVSTGPVVDFRLKEWLRREPAPDAVPLLYPQHFQSGSLRYPVEGKKPNAIVANAETWRWLYPAGWYVVTRRFTTKEEKRRIVAHVVSPERLPSNKLAFENHLNVFHSGKAGIEPLLALGLSLFLNSTLVDDHFRVFSGHTQVNATDLRNMRYPSRELLKRFGAWAAEQDRLDQADIDNYLKQLT